jgi:hypothetical protein
VPWYGAPIAPVPTSLDRSLLAPYPVRAREHPCGTDAVIIAGPANNGGIPVSGKRDGLALRWIVGANDAGTDKLGSLLTPFPTRAREDPRGPSTSYATQCVIRTVAPPTHDGSIPVTGKRNRPALPRGTYTICADQLCLLAPYPTRAREDPCCADSTIVIRPTNNGAIPISGKRD